MNEEDEFNLFLSIIEKQSKKLNEIHFVMEYLCKFKELINLLKSHTSNYQDFLYFLSIKMKIQNKLSKNIVFRYGDKTDKFYIILKGCVSILLPEESKIEMNEQEYFLYLMTLRKYNEFELIHQLLNKNFFPIKERLFEQWLKNHNTPQIKLPHCLLNLNYIDINDYISKKSSDITFNHFTIDEYIENSRPKLISRIHNAKRKVITILIYKEIKQLKEGDKFGDFGFSNLTQKR